MIAEPGRGRGVRGINAIAWVLIGGSAVALLLFVALYGVNGPYWDHVNSAEIFYRWDKHEFTFEYLFRQHNEHRIAAPRLVILALGSLTRWHNRPEMYLHWALMCATAFVVFGAFSKELAGRGRALLLFVPMMFLLVSPRSYEALLGDGFPHYLSILFIILAWRILAFSPPTIGNLAAAIGCGLITSFSIANGLLVWPLGLALLLANLRARAREPNILLRAAIWTAAGVLVYAFYFHGYTDPGNHTSPRLIVQHPTVALRHFLTLSGSVMAPDTHGAQVFGLVAVVLYSALGIAVLVDWWRNRERPPFGFWLVVLALISQALITANRAGFGIEQGLTSRYTAMLALAPVGLYWCLAVRAGRWQLAPQIGISFATLMVVGYMWASLDSWTLGPVFASDRRWVAYLFYSAKYQASALLEDKLYPNGGHAKIYAAEMERMRYNVFADPHVSLDGLQPSPDAPPYLVDRIDGLPAEMAQKVEIDANGWVDVRGWAANHTNNGPARGVFLTIDGTRDVPGVIGLYRTTLGGPLRSRARRWMGFAASFAGTLLTPGDHTITLKIVLDDGQHYYETPALARVVRK